jgi:hypothetical protein
VVGGIVSAPEWIGSPAEGRVSLLEAQCPSGFVSIAGVIERMARRADEAARLPVRCQKGARGGEPTVACL